MRATIKDVSALAGVSTKTVSRVLNKERYVSEEARARVDRAVAELNFRPSAAARTLAGRRSHQIALLYDNHSPHYIHQIQTGVWARCIEEGVRLLAQPCDAASVTLSDEVGGLIDQILMRRLRVEGFFIPDFLHRGAEFMPQLRRWLDTGKLTVRFDETQGLDNVLTAYARMMTGRSTGKVVVRL